MAKNILTIIPLAGLARTTEEGICLYCAHCGQENDPENIYCPGCGSRLVAAPGSKGKLAGWLALLVSVAAVAAVAAMLRMHPVVSNY